ncbi:LPXTG cell wall anchor domain-containing protein [Ligilactobacillus salivarius]|nr:LPXTG cell wall anchor domain-containing protein [Ligilactobacillus salivarius]MDN4847756.1 LPXTG cell wall anchor domain-containing protein [Ligilactobacillus salivarius]
MKKNRIDFKEKRRYAIKKVSGKTASVFIGATIFGIILSSNLSIVNTKADTVSNTTATTISNDQTSETSNVVTLRNNQKNENSSNEAAGSVQNVTSNTESNVSAENKAPSTENATPKSDTPEVSAPVKSNANTSAAPAMGMATNTQDTTQDKDKQTNANETTQNTTNVDKKDTEVTPTNDATTLATQKTAAKFNVLALRRLRVMEEAKEEAPTAETPDSTDPDYSANTAIINKQDIKLDSQPMLTEIINKPKDNWVYKNMKWYPGYSTAKVKEILQNHTTNDESGRYYFAGAANYNESYHVIYLLARSNNLNDNKLYVTILHTGTGNIQEEVVAPGESKKVKYDGTSGTTHAPIFTNYDGTSVSIDLDGVEKGDKNTYGMVVGFAYGYDTGIYGEPASMGNGFMTTPMPTKVTTTIHYVDQATGDELAVPKSFEGVAYQKYTITGEAPTIDGYTLKKSPETTGYISPYKVGESYDFRLDKHVVIKQTVIDSQGSVRVTAYYDGEVINNTTRYLGNMANVNDHYSFISHGKSYTYINQITSTNDGIVYYYAKDGSEDKSEVRVHYIDVTGNKSSLFVPGDGEEVATDKISGKLGENYNYNVNLPTDYNLATNQANTVNGTYTINHHDEYVYVVKKTSAEKLDPTVKAKTKVDDKTKLTDDEKKEVEDNIRDNNPGLPEGTKIEVGDNGDTTITYPDKSVDTITGDKLVEEKTSAEKLDPTVKAKTKVDDKTKLTDDEKKEVEDNIRDNNPGLPEGTKIEVGDNGDTTITYPDKSVDTITGDKLVEEKTSSEKLDPTVKAKTKVDDKTKLTDDEKKEVEDNIRDNNPGLPEGTKIEVGDNGDTTITYPDKSVDTITGDKLVEEKTSSEKLDPTVKAKTKVDDKTKLTDDEKKEVEDNIRDNNPGLPEGTKIEVGDNGDTTITYPDKSVDTITGDKLVEEKTSSEKLDPTVKAKTKVDDKTKLTDDEKKEVEDNIRDNNPGLPEGTKIEVGDNGDTTITYPDKSVDTITGDKLVEEKTSAEKLDPTVKAKTKVDDKTKLTDDEKKEVEDNIRDNNPGLPEGTKIEVGDNGDTTITYPDKSVDTITGDKLVEEKTSAEKLDPTVKAKTKVDDKTKLTDDEKKEVEDNIRDNNPGLPEGTKIEVGDNGDTTITYPDKSVDTITGDKLVEEKTSSEKLDPTVKAKTKVDDKMKLTDDEKKEVEDNIRDNNPGLPEGTKIEVGDNGDTTITYPDKSVDTITGDKLVEEKTSAEKLDPTVKAKTKVDDKTKLTDDEKKEVEDNIRDNNPGLPEGTKIEVGDNGDTTITYPDKSVDTITGDKLVEEKTSAEKLDPTVKAKTKVDDKTKLTDDEKKEVEDNIRDNNPGLPEGTKIEVGDNGDTTITYPDKSVDTITGDKLVEEKTSSEKLDPTVKAKTKVDDKTKLTDDEKKEVEDNIRDNNPGLPEGTKIEVGDNGDTTITYPDKSVDTITGDKLVEEKTSSEKLDPTVKAKTKVDDKTKLTDDEKKEVEDNIRDNNPGLPEGTKIEVGDNGDTTITYPDKSVDTITGDKLVEEKTSSEKLDPTVKAKTKVDDKTKLTDDEKKEVEDNIRDNNPGLPEGTKIEVGDNGDTTITYPDKSVDTITGDKLVEEKTSAEKLDPTVKAKTKVDDKTKLTDDEKKEVEDNIRDNNPGLPEGTKIEVGDNGDTTITYPDKSVDTITGDKLVEEKTSAEKLDPTVKAKTKVDDKTKLTDDEKKEVEDNIRDNNPGLPEGTKIEVGDNGDTTITYPDKSVDTITGDKLVEEKTSSEKLDPTVKAKTKVDDKMKLTDDEKKEVEDNIRDNNPGLPEGTKIEVGDNGDTTITYPDKSVDTITGDKLVEEKTSAEKLDPTVKAKTKVDDKTKLTDDEKKEVEDNIRDNNPGLPEETKIDVGDNGDVTVTYPDGSKDTIPGDKVVEGKSDADKNEPKEPGDKVKVDDPNKLTEDEKSEVVKAVEDANKDENGKSTLPEGSKVTVGDNGDVTVTYPDGSKDTIPGNKVVEGKGDAKSDADKNEPKEPGDKVKVDDPNKLTEDEKSEVVKAVEDANKDENGKSTLPEGSKVTVGDNGDVTVTYPDGSKDTIPGDKVVEGKSDADKNEPKEPGDKVKVDDPNKLTEDEKSEVVKAVEDANKDENGKSTLPEGSKVTVGDNGDVTVTYPDGSKDTIPGDKVLEGKSDADKNEPKEPGDKVKVDDPNKLTDSEKSEVVKAVEDANKDENGKSTLPEGSKVTVGDNGDVTVTYPDGSKDTIPGDKVVEGKSDADKNEPKEPGDKVKVDDPNKLTDSEKSEVVKAVEDANKDENGKSTLPEGSKVTVGDNGDVTVTYPDGSKDTIPGDKVVEGKSDAKSDADKNEPKEPGDKVKVDDPNKLTDSEKSEVVKAVEDANKDENGKSTLPEGSKVTVGDNGDVTVTYPDGSKDTIPGDKVVEGKSDADKNEPKEPGDKVKVDDPNKLTDSEKSEVVKAVEDANKDENGKSTLPEGSKVTVGDNGDVTVTYPDGSKDTIPGDKVVEGKSDAKSDADKNEPKEPGDKVKVDDPNKLTDSEKSEVVKAVEDANKDENGKSTLPEGSKVTVGDNGDVTVTYPDGSKDTIPGDKVVEGKSDAKSDADKNEPKEPGDKVKVDDPNKLTDSEKSEVVKAVEDANKDENGKSTLPEGSKVTVGDNGDVTVTYPDGSKDTIPGDKVVEGKSDAKSDADKNEPKEPGDKVKVDDPNKLTDSEKSEVVKAVEDANKDENGKSTLPEGSKVTVGDNGDVTVTYPDGSKDTIPGDKVVEGKSDADKNEPKEPGDKVKVDDPNKLTDSEKSEVVKAVEDANKDENGKSTLPEGSKVTVGDNGDVTVTYPDGSKDTIPGDKVVEGKSDADKNEPKEPGDKVKVDDPNKLTDSEKSEVVKAVEDANKDENGKSTLPEGSKVTVGDNGDVTVTYPDGSKDTILGNKVVEGKSDADKNEPKEPGDKVKVDDPNKLTDSEKSEVVKAVEDANKDENGKSTLPEGSKVTVGDNGDVTVTYPDGSKDTIPGDKVVEGKSDADKNEPKEPGDKVKVDDPNKLTDSEKSEVVKAVEDANKDENGKSTLPEGSKVTVGDNGDVTVTYPDGSKDTIPGDKVVEGKSDAKSDADKNEPKEPGNKVKVDDPNKLTDSEKEELSNNLEKLNPGTVVTIADDGTATLTYPDGSTNTIPGSQLVTAKGNGNTTNSNVKVTPTNTNNKINKDNNSLRKNTANAKAGELPQTGETNDSQKLSVIGMALMGILGLFGLGKKRKKD